MEINKPILYMVSISGLDMNILTCLGNNVGLCGNIKGELIHYKK